MKLNNFNSQKHKLPIQLDEKTPLTDAYQAKDRKHPHFYAFHIFPQRLL